MVVHLAKRTYCTKQLASHLPRVAGLGLQMHCLGCWGPLLSCGGCPSRSKKLICQCLFRWWWLERKEGREREYVTQHKLSPLARPSNPRFCFLQWPTHTPPRSPKAGQENNCHAPVLLPSNWYSMAYWLCTWKFHSWYIQLVPSSDESSTMGRDPFGG